MSKHNTVTPEKQAQFTTVDSILNGCCANPKCNYDLRIQYFHVGGRGLVPYVTCSNPNGGASSEHVWEMVEPHVAHEYLDFVRAEAEDMAYGVHNEEVEA